jgi:hypothetical protein
LEEEEEKEAGGPRSMPGALADVAGRRRMLASFDQSEQKGGGRWVAFRDRRGSWDGLATGYVIMKYYLL